MDERRRAERARGGATVTFHAGLVHPAHDFIDALIHEKRGRLHIYQDNFDDERAWWIAHIEWPIDGGEIIGYTGADLSQRGAVYRLARAIQEHQAREDR